VLDRLWLAARLIRGGGLADRMSSVIRNPGARRMLDVPWLYNECTRMSIRLPGLLNADRR
jgi:hypothetical protein